MPALKSLKTGLPMGVSKNYWPEPEVRIRDCERKGSSIHLCRSCQLLSSSRHVFTNFPFTSQRIFSPIFFSCKKKQFSYWFFSQFVALSKNNNILRKIWWKKFVDSYWENSSKYVVSSTFVHFHVITTSDPTTTNSHQVGHGYRKHHQDQLNFVKNVMSY